MLRTPFNHQDALNEKHQITISYPPSPTKKHSHTIGDKHLDDSLYRKRTLSTDAALEQHDEHGVASFLNGLADAAVATTTSYNKLSSPLHTPDVNYFDHTRMIASFQGTLRQSEPHYRPTVAIFQNNRDILPTMRCKLVNWLIEVSLHFRLYRETLYLAIHYIDRYLSLHWGISKNHLQLIGIASLFIASKLEEIHPPNIKDFAQVCDGTCSSKSIHMMELDILTTIQWKLNGPTPYYWLGSYLELLKRTHLRKEAIEALKKYSLELIDLAMHTSIFVTFPYSMIAAATLYIRLQDEELIWNCTGYRVEEIKSCLDWLWSLFGCPGYVVYFDPSRDEEKHDSARINEDDFDCAIGINFRIMNYLMDQMRLGQL